MAKKTTPDGEAQADSESPAPATARATYHLPPDLIEKVRDVAWWDRETINAVVRTSIEEHLSRRETERGEPYARRGGSNRRGRSIG